MPPPYSAKKIDGVPAYKLARRSEPVELRAVTVTVSDLVAQLVRPMGWRGSACGARRASTSDRWRTSSGRASGAAPISRRSAGCAPARSTRPPAVTLAAVEAEGRGASQWIIPIDRLLPARPGGRAERTGCAAGDPRQRRHGRGPDWRRPERPPRLRQPRQRAVSSPGAGASWTRGARCSASRSPAPAGLCIPSSSWCKMLSQLEL